MQLFSDTLQNYRNFLKLGMDEAGDEAKRHHSLMLSPFYASPREKGNHAHLVCPSGMYGTFSNNKFNYKN